MWFSTFVTISLCAFVCNAFLLEGTSRAPSELTEDHFITVMKLLLEEKQQRHDLEAAVTKLYNDYFALHKNYSALHQDYTGVSSELTFFKNKTAVLQESYIDIEQKYLNLQSDYKQVLQELVFSKDNMTELRKELNDLKELKAINQTEDIRNLHNETHALRQKLQTVDSKVSLLCINQQARGQDFLALYNQTVAIKSSLLHQEKITQQDTIGLKYDVHQLKKNQTAIFTALSEAEKLMSNISLVVTENQQKISDTSRQIGLTSCVPPYENVSANSVILFPSTKMHFGITDLPNYQRTGIFSCTAPGLYLVAVTITSHTYNAHFYLYKNSNKLYNGFVSRHPGQISNYKDYDHTGTIVVVIELDINDTVTVKTGKMMHVSDWNSCITIVKIK